MLAMDWFEPAVDGFPDMQSRQRRRALYWPTWLMLFLMPLIGSTLGCKKEMPATDKPISKAKAKEIATQAIKEMGGDHQFVIIDEKTVHREFGWVFYYDTEQAIKTGDKSFSVPGAPPIAVLKQNGKTKFLSSSVPPQVAIDIFENEMVQALESNNENPNPIPDDKQEPPIDTTR